MNVKRYLFQKNDFCRGGGVIAYNFDDNFECTDKAPLLRRFIM